MVEVASQNSSTLGASDSGTGGKTEGEQRATADVPGLCRLQSDTTERESILERIERNGPVIAH
jgi:hypothetical protein